MSNDQGLTFYLLCRQIRPIIQLFAPTWTGMHVLVLAGLFATALCMGHAVESQPPELARMGKQTIESDEIEAFIARMGTAERAALIQDSALLKKTMASFFLQRILLGEAIKENWDKRPEVVSRLEQLRNNAIIEEYLQARTLPPSTYPTESEMKKYYTDHLNTFHVVKQYRLAQIYIAIPKNVTKENEQKAMAKLKQTKVSLQQAAADFAAIARLDSDDKLSRDKGGDLGWVAESQIESPIRSAIKTLKKGEITDPIRLSDGWHILKCVDVREAGNLTFEEVREQLASKLRAEKQLENRKILYAHLLKNNTASINEAAIVKILRKFTNPKQEIEN